MRWTRPRTPPGDARKISPRISGVPARRRSRASVRRRHRLRLPRRSQIPGRDRSRRRSPTRRRSRPTSFP